MKRTDPILVTAVGLAAVAFAGSYSHTQTVVSDHGQHGWISYATAAMPEVSVLIAVLKLARARRTGEATLWAWVVGVTAAAFTVSANLATAQHSGWGYVVAVWPAWASIGATLLTHVAHPQVDGQEVAGDGEAAPPPPPEVLPDPAPPVETPPVVGQPLAATVIPRQLPAIQAPPPPKPMRRSKTPAQAWDEIHALIAAGHLPDRPTGDGIREAIAIGPARARHMRDLIQAGASRPATGDGWPS